MKIKNEKKKKKIFNIIFNCISQHKKQKKPFTLKFFRKIFIKIAESCDLTEFSHSEFQNLISFKITIRKIVRYMRALPLFKLNGIPIKALLTID